jgi:hypothetical protein
MINPAKLRELTLQAIANGEAERQRKIDAKAAEEKRKQREAEVKAQGIIEKIPQKCEAQARDEHFFAIVMNMTYGKDYTRDYNGVKPEDLLGAAPIVWKYCVEAGLRPTLERWDDGMGINGGYNITVHWGES